MRYSADDDSSEQIKPEYSRDVSMGKAQKKHEKNIFPAYHTFIGVFLEEGESLVELEYRPPYRPF